MFHRPQGCFPAHKWKWTKIRPTNILVLDSQEPIIVGSFGTQQENDFDSLAQMQSQTLSKQIGVSRNDGSGKGNVSQVFSQVIILALLKLP